MLSFITFSIERTVFSNCLFVCLLLALIDVCFCIFLSQIFLLVFCCCCCRCFLFRLGCSSSLSLESSLRTFLHENSKPNGLLYQVHLIFGNTFSRQFLVACKLYKKFVTFAHCCSSSIGRKIFSLLLETVPESFGDYWRRYRRR